MIIPVVIYKIEIKFMVILELKGLTFLFEHQIQGLEVNRAILPKFDG